MTQVAPMTQPEQPAAVSTKKVLRSPNYPSMSLRAAVEKARVVWDKEKKHPVLDTVLYGHWEYGAKSSGGRSALSALLKYGLLVDVDNSSGREVKLSDSALQILMGEPDQKAAALKTAALAPKLYSELWQKYGSTLPSEESLKGKLIIESGFNPDVVSGFISDYKDTIEFAGLTGEAKSVTTESEADARDETKGVKTPDPQKGTVTSKPLSRESVTTITKPKDMLASFKIPLGLSEAELIFTGESLLPEDFDALSDYVKLFKRQYERKLEAQKIAKQYMEDASADPAPTS